MVERRRRRWVRYTPSGEPARWWAQPLYWALGYLTACAIVQTVAALYWVSRGDTWFDSAAGQQVPILLSLIAVLAVAGLSRTRSR